MTPQQLACDLQTHITASLNQSLDCCFNITTKSHLEVERFYFISTERSIIEGNQLVQGSRNCDSHQVKPETAKLSYM